MSAPDVNQAAPSRDNPGCAPVAARWLQPKEPPAVDLTRRGFRVFPLKPNSKIPPAGSWLTAASDVADSIGSVFQNSPQANVGVATGHGLMVLDVDCKNDQPGLESLEFLKTLGLPDSLTARTPSGGVHIYLRTPNGATIGNSVGRIAPGVDVRAHHGYVVAPGSTIEGVAYEWVDPDQPIADAPDWLLQMCAETGRERHVDHQEPLGAIDTPEALARGAEWLRESAPVAQEGAHGDITTFKVAATLKDFGVGLESAHQLMLEHWDGVKSFPAWGDDLMAKVESAFKSGRNRPGSANAAAQFGVVELDVGSADETRRSGKLLQTGGDFIAGFTPPDYLVHRILQRRYFYSLTAPTGAGKTAIALRLGAHVELGRRFGECEVEQGRFLYFAGENPDDVRMRWIQWRRRWASIPAWAISFPARSASPR